MNSKINKYYCRHCGRLMGSIRIGTLEENNIRDFHICNDEKCKWFVEDRYYGEVTESWCHVLDACVYYDYIWMIFKPNRVK